MKKLNLFVINKKIIFLLMTVFYGVVNAQCIPYTGQIMTSGNTYCINGNYTIASGVNIPNGATLIVQSGQFQVSGVQVMGILEINDGASVRSNGSITIGTFGTQVSSKVKLGTKSFLSLTGSVIQGDPSFGGLYPGTSMIEMGSWSAVEICGTFTQQSKTYPSVKYVGAPNAKAYCIAKAEVSGGGDTAVISDDNQIVTIAMSSVVGLGAGGSSFCGPNATSATCPSLWPSGLSNDKDECGNAPAIINELDSFCTKLGAAGTPDGFTKFGITVQQKANAWPENVPNGFLAMEAKNKGFVITRVQHVSQTPQIGDAIADPKEGMLLYDIQDKCVKLYNGSQWKCVERSCND
ncbi:hypothetical protein SAMN05421768_108142 [Chryseobacterium joostei]|uniref:Uncharacterized protein n=2 Tax=Chryseobacterium joostei TaxID=112234 RepID=A0A1N7I1I4_9FLAO|nr:MULTISPECIES: hypothetical protein [Chryseobacterium]SIS30940.1 hypothetical protein SAMN05421768_102143 [Chryseobacterium joostei]SIS47286.1 hypothetical protein SAMN05421768_108142 [Chryseobacterium joostei]